MDFHLSDDIEIQQARKHQGPCNPRIDILSIPGKRRVLSLWMDYARYFEPMRLKMIKRMLQELYSLSPEDTEAYFEQLRQEAKKQALRKRLTKKMKKKFIRRLHRDQRARAYRLFEKLLRRGMCFAFHNCLPPFMSIRLKQISDVILEQLCELRELPVPDRATEDKLGLFLIVVADWFAVALEQIFYMVYIKKNLALEEMQENAKQEKLQRIAKEKELASEMLDVDPEAIVDPITIEDDPNV